MQSEYEQQRLLHIKRNQEFMARLGISCGPIIASLGKSAEQKDESLPKKRKRIAKERDAAAEENVRRSGRLSGQKPEFSHDIINNLEEEEEEEDEEDGDANGESLGLPRCKTDYQTAFMNSMKWLEESRHALLQIGFCDGKPPQSEDQWKNEAVKRWGNKLVDVHMDDWETYVLSRMSTPPPPSELDLLQEYYAHDVWCLLVCCVLMGRVSSWEVKHNCISAFFENYPTPSALLDAKPEEVAPIIHPLGLFPTRMQSLIAVSTRFLEMPSFNVGLTPDVKIYGIGEFGFQSYLIFCKNQWDKLNPADATLKSFVNWQRKNNALAKDAGTERQVNI